MFRPIIRKIIWLSIASLILAAYLLPVNIQIIIWPAAYAVLAFYATAALITRPSGFYYFAASLLWVILALWLNHALQLWPPWDIAPHDLAALGLMGLGLIRWMVYRLWERCS